MQTTIDDVISTLQVKWGRETIRRGAKPPRHQRHLSTGSQELDALLGGGWSVGEGQSLVGHGSSGATTLAYRTLAAAQAEGLWPLWVDLPRTFDPLMATTLNVDFEQLTLVRPASVEEMLRLLQDVLPLGGPVIVSDAPGERSHLPPAAHRLRRYLAPSGLLLWLLPLQPHGTPPHLAPLQVKCQRETLPHPTTSPSMAWQSTVSAQRHGRSLGSISLRLPQ